LIFEYAVVVEAGHLVGVAEEEVHFGCLILEIDCHAAKESTYSLRLKKN
jgi:hypothetical protein